MIPTLFWLWAVVSAWAQSVSSCSAVAGNQAPTAYDSAACGGTCVVTLVGSFKEVECEMDAGGSGGAEGWAVYDYDGSADREFSSWGTDDSGTDFCCVIDDEASNLVDTFKLRGDSGADFLSFKFSSGIQLEGLHRGLKGEGGADTWRDRTPPVTLRRS